MWTMGNFRRNIIKKREGEGWSQHTAAMKIGISSTELSQLEDGKRCPSVKSLIAVAKAYDTTPDELMGGW